MARVVANGIQGTVSRASAGLGVSSSGIGVPSAASAAISASVAGAAIGAPISAISAVGAPACGVRGWTAAGSRSATAARADSREGVSERGLVESLIVVLGVSAAGTMLVLLCSGMSSALVVQGVGWYTWTVALFALLVCVSVVMVTFSEVFAALCTKKSLVGIMVMAAACLVCEVTVCPHLPEAGSALSCFLYAFPAAALVILWATYLSALPLFALRTLVGVSVVGAAVISRAVSGLEWADAAAGACGLASLACLSLLLVKFRGTSVVELLIAPANPQISLRGFLIDAQTGIGVGATIGMTMAIYDAGKVELDVLLTWSIAAFALGAALSTVLILVFKEQYYLHVKHLHSIMFSIGILAFLVLPIESAWVSCVYLTGVSAMFLSLHCTSSVEFLQIYTDNPLRLIFLGVGAFFSGAIISVIICAVASTQGQAMWISLAAAIVVVVMMALHLVVIYGCVYPYEAIISEQEAARIEEAVLREQEEAGESHQRRERRLEEMRTTYALTKREFEVLELMARGRNAKYITEQLVVSPATAKTHIYHLYAKLGVHTQQELIDMVEKSA